MADVLTPRLLDESMIDRAYALVRNLAPNVSPARWQEFAGPRARSRPPIGTHGFMSVQNGTGCILGLYRFEVRETLDADHVLCADNIIVANLPGRDSIWAAMAETMEALARANGCRSIRAEFFTGQDLSEGERAWFAAACTESGYAVDGGSAFKLLPVLPQPAAGPER